MLSPDLYSLSKTRICGTICIIIDEFQKCLAQISFTRYQSYFRVYSLNIVCGEGLKKVSLSYLKCTIKKHLKSKEILMFDDIEVSYLIAHMSRDMTKSTK